MTCKLEATFGEDRSQRFPFSVEHRWVGYFGFIFRIGSRGRGRRVGFEFLDSVGKAHDRGLEGVNLLVVCGSLALSFSMAAFKSLQIVSK